MKYIIGSRDRTTMGDFSIRPYPKIHHDLGSADAEAARLCKGRPEREFIVFQMVSAFKANDVVKTDFTVDEDEPCNPPEVR